MARKESRLTREEVLGGRATFKAWVRVEINSGRPGADEFDLPLDDVAAEEWPLTPALPLEEFLALLGDAFAAAYGDGGESADDIARAVDDYLITENGEVYADEYYAPEGGDYPEAAHGDELSPPMDASWGTPGPWA